MSGGEIGALAVSPGACVVLRIFVGVVSRWLRRLLDARGDDESAAFASAEPMLATLAGASVAERSRSEPARL